MEYPYLLFDLDGTLSNSAEGITNAVTYALERMGIEPPPKQDLMHFIGPPLIRTFTRDYDLTQEEGQRAVAFYREYYNVKGVFECEAYEGIERLLKTLQDRGYRMAVATCKPTVTAAKAVNYLGLAPYFEMISGPEFDGTRNEKHEVIAYAMEKLGLEDPDRILMVGDRRDDVLGAARCGIGCAGVLWGFGSEQELLEAGAIKTVKAPDELLDFVENFIA